MNKLNPYSRLLQEVQRWMHEFRNPSTFPMFFWKTSDLNASMSYRLDDVYQRALAAKTLGFEVVLEVDANSMQMRFRKKLTVPPGW